MNLPRIRFAHLPTPIESMPRLSAVLQGPKLWIKRDDCTGLAFGGNKTRKLEFVLAEAQANGAKAVITSGAVQSNHCRQTAAMAAKFGLECILVLFGEPEDELSGNVLLDNLFGAKIVLARTEDRDVIVKKTFEEAWQKGKRPFLLPVGASTPTGAIAYYYAFKEFMEQDLDCNWIILPSSSGGTQAGLALGAKDLLWHGKVMGINVGSLEKDLKTTVAGLANEAADRMNLKTRLVADEVQISDEYCQSGYGNLGESEVEAIKLFAKYEGILIDPVYTGRAAAAMIDLIRKGFFKYDETILFWHTGGTPALFSGRYSELIGA
jgi:D-cysteine desulfhydrase family pyridoxal phosphate-dependent enzyme